MKRVYRGLKQHGRQALRTHLMGVARATRPTLAGLEGAAWVSAVLANRTCVRHQTQVVFDDTPLLPGTFGRAEAAAGPDGNRVFTLSLMARFSGRPAEWPLLVAYHLPSINYGRMPTADDALAFGAELLGLDEEAYYQRLCALVDEPA